MTETETRTHSGVQAADLDAALRDGRQLANQRPTLKKSKLLIESLRYEGQSKLTAADHKLYQMLLAVAREQGAGQREYEADMGQMASFLGEPHLGRIRASLERLARTHVTYDFVDGEEVRRWGVLKLLGFEGTDDLRNGTSKLSYWFDPPVQRELVDAPSYASLDLFEVSQLRSRYAPRLHELLALPAGYDDMYRKPLRVAPEDLAAKLGYAPSKFNFAVFRRDVLDPAMADIAEAVTSFRATVTEKRAGRGRGGGKVVELVFEVTPRARLTVSMQAARVSSHVYKEAREGDPDMPTSIAVGRAVTAHGESDLVLWSQWKDVIAKAKANPNADLGGMEAGLLLSVLGRDGADAAFTLWADATFGKKRPAPAFLRDAAAPTPKAEPVEVKKAPVPSDKDVNEFVRAVDEVLWRKPKVDMRSPRQKAQDEVRVMARDIADLLDGYKPGTGRTVKLDSERDDEFVDSGWVRRMCMPEYGWDRLGEQAMSDDTRRAWLVLEQALGVICRGPLTTERDRSRRGPLREIASAVADWDLDRAVGVAKGIVAKAPAQPQPVRRPPAFLTRGMAYRPVTEAHAETEYRDVLNDLAS